MRNINPDDRRYMSFEQRAIDDPRYRGSIKRDAPAVRTCYCGKTVIEENGHPNGVTCPRNCEQNRVAHNRVAVNAAKSKIRNRQWNPDTNSR